MKKRNIDIPVACEKCQNSNHYFCSLSHSELSELSYEKANYNFKKGEIIFREGERAGNLFCVYKGKIKLTKLGKEGKEQIVRLSKDGDILGYRSLLSFEPYQATAIALEDSYICKIPREKFISVVENNPKLSLKLIELLSSDLKIAENHLLGITQKRVKERVSEALIWLINTFGYLLDGETINIKITRAEIAEMASTTTESAIRILSQLKDDNIIRLSGKRIVILNFEELINCTNTFD